MSAPALWTVDDMAAAMGAERQGTLPADDLRPLDRYPHDQRGRSVLCIG